jgi:hypothetical protein
MRAGAPLPSTFSVPHQNVRNVECDEARHTANVERHGLDFADEPHMEWDSRTVRPGTRFDYPERRNRECAGKFRVIGIRRVSAKEVGHHAKKTWVHPGRRHSGIDGSRFRAVEAGAKNRASSAGRDEAGTRTAKVGNAEGARDAPARRRQCRSIQEGVVRAGRAASTTRWRGSWRGGGRSKWPRDAGRNRSGSKRHFKLVRYIGMYNHFE